VHALSSLTHLRIWSIFDRPLDDYSQLLYTLSPSPLMPALREFTHHWQEEVNPDAASDDDSDSIESYGSDWDYRDEAVSANEKDDEEDD
jgi:hypothetical protein